MQQSDAIAWSQNPNGGISAQLMPILALLLVGASFVLQGSVGLNLADEGQLWHGVMRVLSGDVPIRDFQAYDPGRYYWSAFWMRLLGSDGIMALRLSVALFQACGLTVGLLLLRRVISTPACFGIAALVLLIWFFPRHKLFDLSLSIFAVYVGTSLIERPSLARHFAAGVYIGAAAVFGRNHGVYAAIALFALAILARIKLDRTRLGAKLLLVGVGTLIGYSPMLLLAVGQQGFFEAVLEGVQLMFRNGTNLTIPVPWPWVLDYGLPLPWVLHELSVSLAFVVMPVFYGAALLMVLREKRPEAIAGNSVFVSAVFVGVVYMHYAFARADAGHLAHSIFPFLFALLSLPVAASFTSPGVKFGSLAALSAFSILGAGMMSPLYLDIGVRSHTRIDVRGDTLTVDVETARAVRAVQAISEKHMRPGEQIAFAPYWATMYGVVGRISPVWETYLIWPDDLNGQQRFIRELDKGQVEWVLIGNAVLDHRDDRRFSHTHPIAWRYLEEHYKIVQVEGLPPDYRLMRR